jgi:hypothetical protein
MLNWYKLAAMSVSEAYDVLGVSPGIDESTLKQVLKRKRKELHPDVNKDPNAKNLFQLNEQAAKIVAEDIDGGSSRRNTQRGADIFDSSAAGYFSDDRLNKLWAEIHRNAGGVWANISSIHVSEGEISKKINYGVVDDSVSYYDWNAVFEDFDFIGLFNYGEVGPNGIYYEVALGQDNQITAQTNRGGIKEEIRNEPLADAINGFYSLVMKMDENNQLTDMDYATLRDFAGGDFELYTLDNILFDRFGSNVGGTDVDFIDVHPFNYSLPENMKEYEGFMDYYCIPANMNKEIFKQHVEHAKDLSYDDAYDYLFSHDIYVTKDIWYYSPEDLYEWLERQEDFLKEYDFQYDNVKEWYKKMKYLMFSEKQVPS